MRSDKVAGQFDTYSVHAGACVQIRIGGNPQQLECLMSSRHTIEGLTGWHSMLSCLFKQWGPQPGLPLAGLGHAHIIMSSSCCVFFSLCVKMFAETCCQTAGFCLCKGLRKPPSSYNTHDRFCHISTTAKDCSTIVRESTQQELPHFPLQVHGQWLHWTSLEAHCSCCSLHPGFVNSTYIYVSEHHVSTSRVAAG